MGVFKKKEDELEDLHKGTTIIRDELMTKDECEVIVKGKYVDGVGCVVDEEERPDGSKVFKQPPLKVIKRRRAVKTERNENIVEEEPVE